MVKLTVQVLDKTKRRPLPWVSVFVEGAPQHWDSQSKTWVAGPSANTDAQGKAFFNVSAGEHLVKVRTQVYQPWTQKVNVPATGGTLIAELNLARLSR